MRANVFTMAATMRAYRASVLHFTDAGQAALESDALLVVGPNAQGQAVVQALGPYAQLAPKLATKTAPSCATTARQ